MVDTTTKFDQFISDNGFTKSEYYGPGFQCYEKQFYTGENWNTFNFILRDGTEYGPTPIYIVEYVCDGVDTRPETSLIQQEYGLDQLSDAIEFITNLLDNPPCCDNPNGPL